MAKKAKKAKKEKRTTDTRWSFPITELTQIDFDEILSDLTRKNPVALGIVKIKKVRGEARHVFELIANVTDQPLPKAMYFVAIKDELIVKAKELEIDFPVDRVLKLFQSKLGVVLGCTETQFTDYINWAKEVKHSKDADGDLKAFVKVVLPTI